MGPAADMPEADIPRPERTLWQTRCAAVWERFTIPAGQGAGRPFPWGSQTMLLAHRQSVVQVTCLHTSSLL